MANSTQVAVSDGSLALLDISIDYLSRPEITVYFDAVLTTDWAWVGDSDKQITFDPVVPNGVEVLVKRTTDISALRHTFSLGAAFTAESLDEDLKQVLHIAQEASEANFGGDFYGDINMHFNRITNVAAAVDPSDVPTFAQVTTVNTEAAASAVAAAASAVAAAQSAVDAADASRLTAGAVTTGSPGTLASVSITGLAGAQVVAFTIPRGDVGPTGPGVPTGGSAAQVLSKIDGGTYNTQWVSLTKATVGLSNVDNTSDADKPISTAQAAGLVPQTAATGAATLPAGTAAERPGAPVNGQLRYNADLDQFEGYAGGSWGSIGGGAAGALGNAAFYENDTNVTADYTITTGKNAMSAGPITIDTGVTVTVPSGSTWSIV